MADKIASRIGRQCGAPDLVEALIKVPASDLKSLLLGAYQARASRLNGAYLMQSASSNSLLRPSSADARVMMQFDRIAFETAKEFEAIDLSPAAPFGISRVLGGIDQNNVLTTIRNVEVPGDCTSALALECAQRRRNGEPGTMRLCASQRVVRLQPVNVPGFTPHFRLFGMVTADRDSGSSNFEKQHLMEHISFYLRLFRELNANGFDLRSPIVEVSDTAANKQIVARAPEEELRERIRAHRPGETDRLLQAHEIDVSSHAADTPLLRVVREKVFPSLISQYPEAEFRVDFSRLEGLSYYNGLCLRISPSTADGERYAVADGGFTNWTARLLQNRKERLLISGIGTEFICRTFRGSPT